MRDNEKPAFAETLIAVLDVYGAKPSPAATSIWWEALKRFDLSDVRAALSRHVQNPDAGKYAPKPADVIRAIAAVDGRPGAEEAWSLCPKSEQESAMITAEMRAGYSAALDLIDAGDLVAARMTFKEVYERTVAAARAAGEPVVWDFSPGWDRNERVIVLSDMLKLGRIAQDRALALTPPDLRADLLSRAGAATHPLLENGAAEDRRRMDFLLNQMGGAV